LLFSNVLFELIIMVLVHHYNPLLVVLFSSNLFLLTQVDGYGLRIHTIHAPYTTVFRHNICDRITIVCHRDRIRWNTAKYGDRIRSVYARKRPYFSRVQSFTAVFWKITVQWPSFFAVSYHPVSYHRIYP
jgi:hypothetical protein